MGCGRRDECVLAGMAPSAASLRLEFPRPDLEFSDFRKELGTPEFLNGTARCGAPAVMVENPKFPATACTAVRSSGIFMFWTHRRSRYAFGDGPRASRSERMSQPHGQCSSSSAGPGIGPVRGSRARKALRLSPMAVSALLAVTACGSGPLAKKEDGAAGQPLSPPAEAAPGGGGPGRGDPPWGGAAGARERTST